MVFDAIGLRIRGVVHHKCAHRWNTLGVVEVFACCNDCVVLNRSMILVLAIAAVEADIPSGIQIDAIPSCGHKEGDRRMAITGVGNRIGVCSEQFLCSFAAKAFQLQTEAIDFLIS